jgi:peptidoglycan/LPS O-acetylase OafA/YrhL
MKIMNDSSDSKRLLWLDIIRGLAILWIFFVHFVERFICCPMFGNPAANWPPVVERISQLAPMNIDGVGGLVINLLRYIGWMGDQGVQIFLVASGFGLTASALSKTTDMSYREFFKRRLLKLVPLWVVAHLLFIVFHILFQKGLSPLDWRTWASLMGFGFLPEVFYFKFAAWWYVGLLLQLYLIFPLMLHFLKRWSLLKFLLVFAGTAILVRLVGLIIFENYLDWWSRGGIFITRLPEFAFGMAFAKWTKQASHKQKQQLISPFGMVCALGAYIIGNVSSFFIVGMAVAFVMTGAAFFVLVFTFFSNRQPRAVSPIAWAGQHSYALYLFHFPVLLFIVPSTLAPEATGKIILYLLLSLSLSICVAVSFEYLTGNLVNLNKRWYKKVGLLRLVSYCVLMAFVVAGVILGAEVLVRKVDPQEVLGWGERPSLAPNSEFGYYLKPNQITRLRWLSYDYTVEANALGFPGKLYGKQKPEGTYRIFVTGDAYSSAEGVDTKDAWPRLLEVGLQDGGVATQVMNFSITGWGPNQYAEVITKYAPVFKPDLILISFFVNEFDDVATSNEDFRSSIGFGQMSQESLESYFRLTHLRAWLRNISFQLKDVFLGKTNPYGYFFGYFSALEKKQLPVMQANAARIQERFRSIAKLANDLQSKVLVVLVPAPAQVCSPDGMKYWPNSINLQDSGRFDLEQPQRLEKELLDTIGFAYIDLRLPLRQAEEVMPCQPRNLHWTKAGHLVVADFITRYLLDNPSFQVAEPHPLNTDKSSP